MNKFRLLNPDEIECRVSTINEKGLSLLLYKTARTDANLLDETVGSENWENDFKVVDGVLYGGIGIYDPQMDRWIWKWDAGVESKTDAEKGRASDAFKRAGFKHGIGRELYTSPRIWITPDKCEIQEKNGRFYCNDRFSVSEIEYNEACEIVRLVISNDKRGVDVFVWTQKRGKIQNSSASARKQGETEKSAQNEAQAPQGAPDGQYYCDGCGEQIKGVKIKGKSYSPADVAHRALEKHKKQLCWECQKKNEMSNS